MLTIPTFSLKYKLPALIVGFSLLVAAVLQTASYLEQRATAFSRAEESFHVAAQARKGALDAWVKRVTEDVLLTARTPSTADAIVRLGTAFAGIPGGALKPLQDVYITNNPNPVGQRQLLVTAEGSFSYFRQHAVFHPYFDELRTQRDFYDVFLFDLNGNAVYTVFKELDFANNFITGPYADSGLGQVYRQALEGKPGEVFMSDFEPYAPSNDAPAGFVASQVVGPNGRPIGVVAFQLPLGTVAAMVNNELGLGETGDAYLTSADGVARTPSRFEGRFAVLEALQPTPQIADIANSVEGFRDDAPLQSGNTGLAETILIKAPGVTWGLVMERDLDEIMAPSLKALVRMLEVTAVCALLVLGLGLLIARSVTRPIEKISQAIKAVADGDLNLSVSGVDRQDEVGQMARALDGLREKLTVAEVLEKQREEQQAAQQHVVEALSIGLQNLSAGKLNESIEEPFAPEYEMLRSDFNDTLGKLDQIMSQVVGTAGTIRARSTEINRASEDLSHRTENQAAALEETAAALDELTSSVKSAADGAREVENIVRQARKEAEESGTVVQGAVSAMTEIEKSSEHISQIIGVIDDIAFQTSLLALNAGVEAARAGDAGRGFAVVASEVRALAQRSSAAAKEIKTLTSASTQHVGRGVDQVGRAGTALASIVDRVAHISTLVSEIASGAAEQSTGLAEINIGVTQLDQVTQQNAAMVEESTAASHALHQEATALAELMSQFSTRMETGRGTGIVDFVRPQEVARVTHAPTPRTAPAPKRSEPKAATGTRGVWQDF